MRDIKFRVWDKQKKIMLYPKFNDISNINWEGHDGKSETDRYVFMQYTSWQDKNDKEIYEGDILLSNQEITKKSFSVVIWGESDKHKEAIKTWCVKLDIGTYWLDSSICITHEVVGNIYENKQLLN